MVAVVEFRAAVMHQAGAPLSIETVTIDHLAPGDVLVRTKAASICHTDLEVLEGELAYPLPMILGHEAAGVVEALGNGDDHGGLAIGDAVALHWNPHCGHCFYCDNDQTILCEPYTRNRADGRHFDGHYRHSLNGQPLHMLMYLGGFAEYMVVPAQSAVKLPAEMPLDRACLLGCGVMTGFGAATRVARVAWGSVVAVQGCGAIGLSAIQGARANGAARVIAIDLDDAKLERARALDATDVCNAASVDPVVMVKEMSHGRGADFVFECAGNEEAFRQSVRLSRPGGDVVWLGKVNVDKDVAFKWGTLMGERRIVRSSYGGAKPAEDFPALARAYLNGTLKLDELVTARIPLDDINHGFDLLRQGEAIRTVIEF